LFLPSGAGNPSYATVLIQYQSVTDGHLCRNSSSACKLHRLFGYRDGKNNIIQREKMKCVVNIFWNELLQNDVCLMSQVIYQFLQYAVWQLLYVQLRLEREPEVN